VSIFKSYDIRGAFGADWDAATAHAIGRHLPAVLGARRIAVGRDARLSSDEIFSALSRGIVESGCDVVDIGLCDTPAVYFATAFYGLDGGVMITASHNPPRDNGLKLSGPGAVPVGYDTGLAELEKLVAGPLAAPAGMPGAIGELDIRRDYVGHLARFRADLSGLKVVIDCSNGMAGIYLRDALEGTGGQFALMFEQPDGRFPNHPPNPLVEENLSALKARVAADKADLGICFDGDADRVMFVDETGRFVSPDLLIGLIGTYYFRLHPERLAGASKAVTYDVRTSRAVVEFLRSLGADPVICRVGHSHAKKLLRETKAIFGGELAGHYYFRENYCCDSGIIAALIVLEALSAGARPFSELMADIGRYFFSGEMNFKIPDGARIVEAVRRDYPEGAPTDIDGIRLDFPTWWFNLRTSNTEPLLRLVVEAETKEGLQARKVELVEKILRYSNRPSPTEGE
jgi:phosphomannomutase